MSDILDGYIITIPASLGTYINGTGKIEVEEQTEGNSNTQQVINEWNSLTTNDFATLLVDPNWGGSMMVYSSTEEAIDAYRSYWLSIHGPGIDFSTISVALKTGSDFVNGTTPPNTNVADLLMGRINAFRSTMSPWGILSENVAIDMDPVKGVSVDLFRYLQIAGILMGMVLILSAIVGYITAQAGQARAQYKASAMHRVLVTCIIAGTVLFLSFVMEVFNLIFGV